MLARRHLVQPICWLAAAVGCLVVRNDTESSFEPANPDVIFLGYGVSDLNRSFQSYRLELAKRAGALGRSIHVGYEQVAAVDAVALNADIDRLSRRSFKVIVAPTGDTALAARRLAPSLGIVFASYPDPVQSGLVASMSRPGGRATGVSLDDRLHAKRLELLKDAFPQARTIGVLADRSWARHFDSQAALLKPARALGLEVELFLAETIEDVDQVMRQPAAEQKDAWYIAPTYIGFIGEQVILSHLKRLMKPAMHTSSSEMASGAIMAYIQDTSFVYGAMADLTLRVVSGEEPATIPVQRPMRHVLAVRPHFESAGVTMDPAFVLRADRIH